LISEIYKKKLLSFLIIIIGCISVLIINNKAENVLDVNPNIIKTMPDNLFNKVKYIAMDDQGLPFVYSD